MYKITIEQTQIEAVIIGNSYEKIKTDGNGESTYGYTPEEVRKKTVSRKIYEQTVNELDVADIAGIVNGITEPCDKR